ncbi:Clavaminate synthase-like protein [Massarina eburnea CBS 473.64]|uniref:Clavaminate synthase-like protein n=1 Tax=Massarina eburnea CBS 473.64 TaxID=1395130 RepID=A0A6A6RNR9_9PLEO|nr:Clavaminate synthase-like protein [Massarina eburnea CBS 473.64]
MASNTNPVFQTAKYPPSIDLPAPYPPNTTFPLQFSPVSASASLSAKLAGIRQLSLNGEIRRLLDTHGAIYFSNLCLASAEEFSQFTHAFGFVPHEDIGNPVRRTILANNVATANEGPNTRPVYPHNEFGLSPHYPAYVFFYCASAPETGGETPINNSIVLYKRLKDEFPEFIDEIEKKGIKYQLTYPNTSRTQTESPGNSVLQAYGQHVHDSDDAETTRAKIEREIRRLPTATWEWVDQSPTNALGDLRTWQVLPAVRPHTRTGQPAFFNNAVSRFLSAVDAGTLDPPHLTKEGRYRPPAFYGDGGLVPRKYFDAAVRIVQETRVLVKWRMGDVVLLDNHAVQHGREPWTGERRLLASLWDDVK